MKPTLLTPETHGVIIRALRDGQTPTRAAYLAGISSATLDGWLQRGRREADGGRYRDFLADYQEARAVQRAMRLVAAPRAKNRGTRSTIRSTTTRRTSGKQS